MNYAVLLAGGIGKRMGQDIPKQFIHIDNKPIIIYTLEVLQQCSEIDRIVCVCLKDWMHVLHSYVRQFGITKLTDIVSGGDTRFKSIRVGMEVLGGISDSDVIVVHDAVRPLVPVECILDVIDVCKTNGNAMAVVDCFDTMYKRTDCYCTNLVMDRSSLVRGQTPEAVSGKRMRELYCQADIHGIELDSISAMQNELGWPVYFAKGSEHNIKLTQADDIELFKALLMVKKENSCNGLK